MRMYCSECAKSLEEEYGIHMFTEYMRTQFVCNACYEDYNNKVMDRMNKQEYIDWLKKVRNNQEEHSDMWYLVDEIIHESKKLEEPETLSQEWIRENQYYSGAYQIVDGEYYIAVKDLQNLLVPKEELTTKQVVEWAHNRCYKLVDCTFTFRTIKGDKMNE